MWVSVASGLLVVLFWLAKVVLGLQGISTSTRSL
jgi:hypothetical protein